MNKPETLPVLSDMEEPASIPLPSNLNSVFLGGIFLLIFLTVIHMASEIVIPIVLAFVLKLVLQPVLRLLCNLYVPRSIAAGLIIVALVSIVIGLGTILSGPAASWGEKIPASYPHLQERLNFLRSPMEKTQRILGQAEDMTKGSKRKAMPVSVQGSRLFDKVFTGTQNLAAGLFTTMLVLFFLLATGDTFLRRLVEVLPRFSDKRQAVDISQQIKEDISIYLLIITAMNAVVGVGTALVMRSFHVDDPILWGVLAFLLNYVPIIGPMLGVVLFLLVGLLVINDFWTAFMPATLYLLIHLTEGSILTPLLLAKRFTLNPVLVILSLVFWYWMWGVPGAILAMPMLAITKIICDRIHRLSAFGHFLEG